MSLQINRDGVSLFGDAPPTLAELPAALAGGATSLAAQVAGAVRDGAIDRVTTPETQATAKFQQEFGDLAQNKDAFHAMMRTVFGEGYDAGKAEQYRQMALKGDFSFLPPVRFVSRETLGGGNGAYNEAEGVIYLASDLKNDPEKMQSVFVEEAGHHLDAMLNTSDSAGDEGEMFRRLMSGERLTSGEMAAIRAENDHGTIVVDGKQVEVEFWFGEDIADAVSDGVDAVGEAVSDAVDAVEDVATSVRDEVGAAVKGVFSAAGELLEGVMDGMAMFATGLYEGISGFVENLFEGKIADAFTSLTRGVDKAFIQAPARIVNGAINSLEDGAKAATHLMGPWGEQVRKELIPRAADVLRQSFNTAVEIGRDVYRMTTETPIGLASDLGTSFESALKGDWRSAVKEFGRAFFNTGSRILGGGVDILAHGLQGLADGVQTATFLAPPSRGLTDEEKAMLKEIYGDSIDYDSVRIKFGGPLNADIGEKRARVVGNTIYMPSKHAGKPLIEDKFEKDGVTPILNPDGTQKRGLSDYGSTLIHESAHIWQSQNGGGDYINQALYAQAFGDGYKHEKGISDGLSWSQLNPEQQGEYIKDVLGPILILPGNAEANLRANLTGPELDYALNALRHIRRGSGTPEANY
jgi:hypothetical protein